MVEPCCSGCFIAGSTATMFTHGIVLVLNSGQSTPLVCEFAMNDFTHFNNPVVWQKSQRHEKSLVNVLATIEPPFLGTNRFHASFQVLETARFRMSLTIVS